ncbi:MAG: HAMP domain-containing histidine kinase [Myxococcales bacterium]|nr:HAMP domain-containing histidine kinase [Myxococcales bacterium]MCB9628752.1 HAMP domain-containing histidine kinase [Sandaracinaceae bacterium]
MRPPRRVGPSTWLLALALQVGVGCEPARTPVDPWPVAQEAFARNDPRAFELWSTLPSDHPAGAAARRRLAQADTHYQEGIRRLAAEDDDGAYREIRRGLDDAPMDPGYYPIIARLYVGRGNDAEAARLFERYLRARPRASDADAVREELRMLSPGASILTDSPLPPPPAAEPAARETPDVPLGAWVALGVLSGLLLAFAGARLVSWLRRRGVSLARLVREQPELHPAIAYLVGSLRHELLKHRVGAAREVLNLLGDGESSPAQRAFLESRLLGGSGSLPLAQAFDAYLRAFERALGGRFDVRSDHSFRAARDAIRVIVDLTPTLATRHTPRRVRRLRAAHAALDAFDTSLKELVDGLIRTDVDSALLQQVVTEVRQEYAPGAVELDSLDVEVGEPIAVEVFRVDLVLVLKNILRNAVLAVGRAPAPRRVRLGVHVALEVTGEETVHIAISDTSDAPLTLAMIRDREFGRGLGLVSAAVDRYGGAISIEPGPAGYVKSVVVSFPCAYNA